MTASRTLLVAGVIAASHAGAQPTPDSAFVRWARTHATDVADPTALGALVGGARVVVLGEPTHGARAPLALRNRLIRELVERHGVTAVALESGLPESQRLAALVAGAPDAPPPADAARVTSRHLTWGFGNFPENVELVRWMRAHNDDPSHTAKIRFYGIDLSLGGPKGSTPTPSAVHGALSYLGRVDTASATELHQRFAPFVARLPDDGGRPFTAAERDALRAAIETLVATLERGRARYVAASSDEAFAWALRNAIVARQSDVVHRATTPSEAMTARDSAMAENVRWALEREGPRGRLLVFAHDVHVKNAPTVGGAWASFTPPPRVMGQYLRRALGAQVVLLGVSGGPSTDPSSVEATLGRVRDGAFLVDLRAAHADRGANAWLASRRPMRMNGDTRVLLAPGDAFDALIYLPNGTYPD